MKNAVGILVCGVLLVAVAWCAAWYLKEQPLQQTTVFPMDRVVRSDRTSRRLLHSTFPVAGYVSFEVDVPPKSINPTVQGSYEAFVKGSGDPASQNTNVQLLLLSDEEFADFAHGNKQGTATYTSDSSESQAVSWVLHPDFEQVRKYYLVFRNLPGGPKATMVKADFNLIFE